jgi:hypothetical protein
MTQQDAHALRLLTPLPPKDFQEYHDHLVRRVVEGVPRALEVRADAGQGKGKGVFAKQAIEEGDLLFKEAPLVRICQQEAHIPRKAACLLNFPPFPI